MKNNFASFNEFRDAFLQELYSIPIQVKVMNEWFLKSCNGCQGNLQEYFFKQVKGSKYFVPPMEEYKKHDIIIQKMPLRVREALVAIDVSNFYKISQALYQLDSIRAEKTKEQRNLQRYRNANNKYQSKIV